MGATHFLLKRLPKVRGEMALHVLAYNLTRVLNILGIQPLMAALRPWRAGLCLHLLAYEAPDTSPTSGRCFFPPMINPVARL
jgi:hypothetical protein